MINSIESYADSGARAGKAAKYQDWGLVSHEKSWYNKAIVLEQGEERLEAINAWSKAYYEESNPRR